MNRCHLHLVKLEKVSYLEDGLPGIGYVVSESWDDPPDHVIWICDFLMLGKKVKPNFLLA